MQAFFLFRLNRQTVCYVWKRLFFQCIKGSNVGKHPAFLGLFVWIEKERELRSSIEIDLRKMSAQAPRKKSRSRFPWVLLVSRWENALEKEIKMAAGWELTGLWFSYLFERSRLVLWPISSGPFSMENVTLGHRLASRFQNVVGYKSTSWRDVFARKGCEKGELFLRFLVVTVPCHVVQKDILKERKNDSWALCRCIN